MQHILKSVGMVLVLIFGLGFSTVTFGQEVVYTYEYESGLPADPPKPVYKPGGKYAKHDLSFGTQKIKLGKAPKPKVRPVRNITVSGTKFPALLSRSDVDYYKAAFAASKRGRWGTLDENLSRVENKLLVGHVLAIKLRSKSYTANIDELTAWLRAYGDHPDAQRIARIATDKGAIYLPDFKGKETSLPIPALEKRKTHRWSKAGSYTSQRKEILRRIKSALYDDRYSDAELALAYEARSVFDDIEIQAQYARIAGEIYYDGTIDEAYRRAVNVINAVQYEVPYAYWIAGLCAWRNQDYTGAARFFTGYSKGYSANRWQKAAGHFWASRAYGKLGSTSAQRTSLENAAKYHETLYGLLARRLMEWDTKSYVQGYKPSKADIDRLLTWKAGRRAFALYQVGEFRRAEVDLMQVARKKEKSLRRTLLRIAEAGNMPELAVRLAHYKSVNDKTHDYRGLYPIPAYKPKGGFKVDRALMFGIMKKESMFDPRLGSSAGARGLAQVYPPTAKWMIKQGMVKSHTMEDLLVPEINLAIAQRYWTYLLNEHKSVKGDLVRFLIGYNAGPNRIKKWEKRARHGGDPLLYFESIPASETRAYVERTLSYIWRYRDRMGQSLAEADQLAKGQWPKYIRMD